MVEWIISSCALILIVTLLRFLLKGRISLRLQYALWGLVLVRLLVPVSFGQSGLSVMNAVTVKQTEYYVYVRQTDDIGAVQAQPDTEGEAKPPVTAAAPDSGLEPDTVLVPSDTTGKKLTRILSAVWIAGFFAAAALFLVSNFRFTVRLRRSRRRVECELAALPIYASSAVETPCLFGLFRPAVYVTPQVLTDEAAFRHVLAHETTHYRHGDHIWALLRCVCLALHWYNPLVWLAASLSRQDGELACDEGAIRDLGEEERMVYGHILIGLTCGKRGAFLTAATTMTGNKRRIKERITLIAKRPKTKAIAFVLVVAVCLVAVGCTFTGAETSDVRDSANAADSEPDSGLTDVSVMRNGGVYYILCDGITELDESYTSWVTDGYIQVMLIRKDGYTAVGPFENSETLVDEAAQQFDSMVEKQSLSQDEAKLLLDIAAKIQSGDSSGFVDLKSGALIGGTLLTEEEIATVNEAFEQFVDNGAGGLMVNPLSCFFTSFYDDPKSLDLVQFLAYFPSAEALTDQKEFDTLKASEYFPFGVDITLEDMPVPVHKISAQAIDEVLQRYAGVSLSEFGDAGKSSSELLYLDEYNAYYNFTSDFAAGYFSCVNGEKQGEHIILYSNHSVLTLCKSGENYFIQSFQPI